MSAYSHLDEEVEHLFDDKNSGEYQKLLIINVIETSLYYLLITEVLVIQRVVQVSAEVIMQLQYEHGHLELYL